MQTGLFDPPPTHFAPLTLRPYQRAAKEAAYQHMRTRNDNPCVVIPTGGGKTPIIGDICREAVNEYQSRVIVLAHVKELLQQAADNLQRVCPRTPVGVFSAGLKRRERQKPVTVAGIQSIYDKAFDFDPFDLAIVDEAHLIAPEGEGRYRTFLADATKVNPNLRIVGFTATPFRMTTGPICTPEGFLNHVCYEVGVRELIVDGFLSPLISKNGQTKVDLSGLHVRGGEFIDAEIDALMDREDVVVPAVGEIVALAGARKSVLIFACSIKHGEHVLAALHALQQDARFIHGGSTPAERDRAVQDFKAGRLKYLVNVECFTTGFDAPNVDCVCLMRPTKSPGLYYQMVGRGFRLFPGKPDCLVLDFAGNVLLHGPVDKISLKETGRKGGKPGDAPAKECPNCHSLIACGYSICPDCGFEFPPPDKPKHDATASKAGILSGQVTTDVYPVQRVFYSRHTKRSDPNGRATLRVDYVVGDSINGPVKSEWICIEHEVGNYGRERGEAWWKRRTIAPFPESAEEAADLADAGWLAEPLEITVRTTAGAEFPERITGYKLGPIPEGEALPAESEADDSDCPAWDSLPSDDDIPF